MPSFWDELAKTERERLDAWQDVEPALCTDCDTVKRGVLFGCCPECFATWEDEHGATAPPDGAQP